MKYIRSIAAIFVFLISCPLSWVAAWVSGTWFTVLLSLIAPTYGLLHWITIQLLGPTFLQSLISWGLAIPGAMISLSIIHSLLKDPKPQQ